MTPLDIARLRLANQQITVHTSQTPQQVVGTLGGAQTQDYQSALWAIGLRLLDATRPQVEQALTNASIVRTWAMRGTLHFVASADVRWIIALLAPRLIAASAYRRRTAGRRRVRPRRRGQATARSVFSWPLMSSSTVVMRAP